MSHNVLRRLADTRALGQNCTLTPLDQGQLLDLVSGLQAENAALRQSLLDERATLEHSAQRVRELLRELW